MCVSAVSTPRPIGSANEPQHALSVQPMQPAALRGGVMEDTEAFLVTVVLGVVVDGGTVGGTSAMSWPDPGSRDSAPRQGARRRRRAPPRRAFEPAAAAARALDVFAGHGLSTHPKVTDES